MPAVVRSPSTSPRCVLIVLQYTVLTCAFKLSLQRTQAVIAPMYTVVCGCLLFMCASGLHSRARDMARYAKVPAANGAPCSH